MTIEFHCPYCTATVRVADSAAGKIGRCPKCDTRVRIPTPEIPASPAPAESSTTDLPSEFPQLPKEFPAVTPPQSKIGQLPDVPISEDPVTAKYLRRSRKKRSFSIASMIAPVLFGGLLVLIGLIYYLNTLPSYIAEAVAERTDPNRSIRVTIEADDYGIPKEKLAAIVDEFRDRPADIRSNLVNLTFQADANGLGVSLSPGVDADLVKVNFLENEAIKDYYLNRSDELDRARLNEITHGLASLCDDWAAAPEGRKNDTLPEYRYSVVYNVFVKGLGRLCQAVVDGSAYPCVHENSNGEFYFLVPAGSQNFTIQERARLPESPFFPSEFRVDVKIPVKSAESTFIEQDVEKEPAEPAPSETEGSEITQPNEHTQDDLSIDLE